MNKREIDAHSINCYKCGELTDEREAMPNEPEYGGNGDGGELCPDCYKPKEPEQVVGYTPGEWVARETTFDEWTISQKKNGRVIGTFYQEPSNYDTPGEREANARLIAASPDLLEALRELCDICEDEDQFPLTVEHARTAINKATNPNS